MQQPLPWAIIKPEFTPPLSTKERRNLNLGFVSINTPYDAQTTAISATPRPDYRAAIATGSAGS